MWWSGILRNHAYTKLRQRIGAKLQQQTIANLQPDPSALTYSSPCGWPSDTCTLPASLSQSPIPGSGQSRETPLSPPWMACKKSKRELAKFFSNTTSQKHPFFIWLFLTVHDSHPSVDQSLTRFDPSLLCIRPWICSLQSQLLSIVFCRLFIIKSDGSP